MQPLKTRLEKTIHGIDEIVVKRGHGILDLDILIHARHGWRIETADLVNAVRDFYQEQGFEHRTVEEGRQIDLLASGNKKASVFFFNATRTHLRIASVTVKPHDDAVG